MPDFTEFRKKIEEQKTQVFYKDITMICNDCVEEWRELLKNNVERGIPFITLFTVSEKDSVYIIKVRDSEEKTYDISDSFFNDNKRKICRKYNVYIFFSCKNFSKYISTTFDAHCTHQLIRGIDGTIQVQLNLC